MAGEMSPARAHYGKPKTKKSFPVYVEQIELDLINSAARACGLERGPYCRAAILRAARQDIGDSIQHASNYQPPVRAIDTKRPLTRPQSAVQGAEPTNPSPVLEPPRMTLEERAERRRRLTAPRGQAAIVAADGKVDSDGFDEEIGSPL
jgi:hypothetical protein